MDAEGKREAGQVDAEGKREAGSEASCSLSSLVVINGSLARYVRLLLFNFNFNTATSLMAMEKAFYS